MTLVAISSGVTPRHIDQAGPTVGYNVGSVSFACYGNHKCVHVAKFRHDLWRASHIAAGFFQLMISLVYSDVSSHTPTRHSRGVARG